MGDNERTMFAEERRRRIVELVNSRKKIVIPELCNHFGVSASTIRNDLRDLQEEGKITRTHGGAIINSKSGFEPLPLEKETVLPDAKRAIAARAAEYVEDGDIIAVTTGTTTFELIRRLDPSHHLTIIVNDLYFAAYLERMENYHVILVGGTLRKNFHYFQMPNNCDYLADINIDKAFITCNGIHVKRGITTPDPHLAFDVKKIKDASAELYVLSDHSKFGSVSFARIAGVEEVRAVVTDSQIGNDDVTEFRAAGVNLIIADEAPNPA